MRLYIMDPGFERRTRIYEEYMMISNKQNQLLTKFKS